MLGQISFALYLVHSPVDSYLRTTDKFLLGSKLAAMPFVFFSVAILVALSSAALLFHFVEEPARKNVMRLFECWAGARRPSAGVTLDSSQDDSSDPIRLCRVRTH